MQIHRVIKALTILKLIQNNGLKTIMESSVFYDTGSRESTEIFHNKINTRYKAKSVVHHDRILTRRT